MMEAGTVHAGGRERLPRPPVRGRPGRSGGSRRVRVVALAGVLGLGPLTGVAGGSSPVMSRKATLFTMWTKTRPVRVESQVSGPCGSG